MANRTGLALATHSAVDTTEPTPNATVTTIQSDAYTDDTWCADFWSTDCYSFGLNRFTFQYGIVVLLVMLQMSMLVLIVARWRRDTSFRQAFYAQFVAVTIVDCFRMITVRLFAFLLCSLMPGICSFKRY